jgi:hypothetical protein
MFYYDPAGVERRRGRVAFAAVPVAGAVRDRLPAGDAVDYAAALRGLKMFEADALRAIDGTTPAAAAPPAGADRAA